MRGIPHDVIAAISYVALRPLAIGAIGTIKENPMAKASKETTPTTMDFALAEDRSCALEDFTVNFVTIRQDHDLGPMLAALPGGMCQCPHWGVITKGRMTVRYADRTEVFEAGDAFYMPPGHAPAAEAGTELIQFSPTDLLAATEAAIADAMQHTPS